MVASCRFTSLPSLFFNTKSLFSLDKQAISPLTHLSSEGFYHSIFILLFGLLNYSLFCKFLPLPATSLLSIRSHVLVHVLSSQRLSFCLYVSPSSLPSSHISPCIAPTYSSGLSSSMPFLNPLCSFWLSILLAANKLRCICSLPPRPSRHTLYWVPSLCFSMSILYLFCSLLYLQQPDQCLEYSRTSINIYWMNVQINECSSSNIPSLSCLMQILLHLPGMLVPLLFTWVALSHLWDPL